MMTAAEYTSVMKSRANFYRFLLRFYYQEVDQALLEQLKATTFPQDCGQSEMEEGYALLRSFLATADADNLDNLAADFAKIFLAAGEHQGKGAFPYESVYTSKKGIVMQEAWEAVKRLYAGRHLALTDAPSELMEDHIAIELQYMALLADRAPETAEGSLLKDQQFFLENHLLNWAPALCADMERYAATDLYRAVAKLTIGYLKLDADMLREILTGEEGDAGSYAASPTQMDAALQKLSRDFRVFAPKRTGKKGRNGEEIVRYGEITSISEIVYDRPSHFSAKEVYYPIMQTMMYFTETESRESQLSDERGILILAHPCDINAARRLDTIFLTNGAHADVYYARLREKVKFALLECSESYDNCFCVSMGSNRSEDYALALRLGEQACLVQVKDSLLLPYFAGLDACTFSPVFVTENKRAAALPVIENKEELKLASSLEFWNSYDEKCISCGGCNTVCPTCACFDTVDVIYNEGSREGERRRVWSSCMLDTFTQTAGGAKARATAGANMRFKTLHKVYDYQKRFQTGENMCVGCGRCITRCPKDIDFLDTVNRFASELEKAKKEGEQ